jgi:hypothetical protein
MTNDKVEQVLSLLTASLRNQAYQPCFQEAGRPLQWHKRIQLHRS